MVLIKVPVKQTQTLSRNYLLIDRIDNTPNLRHTIVLLISRGTNKLRKATKLNKEGLETAHEKTADLRNEDDKSPVCLSCINIFVVICYICCGDVINMMGGHH